MTANDFVLQDGLDHDRRYHPDFSTRGRPLQFGFIMRDTNPKEGHFGLLMVGAFGVTALGPAPASFPFTDGSWKAQDWNVRAITEGGPVEWKEGQERGGGNPGKHLKLALTMGDRAVTHLIHICQKALYSPAIQGSVSNVDISLDVRMASESSGQNVNATTYAVVIQNGAVYAMNGRMATYSDQNAGWATLEFVGLTARDFVEMSSWRAGVAANYPDFSSKGAPMRFGFATYHNAFYNNPAGHGFKTAIDFDNFVVKVYAIPPAFR
jgi:hypothetical protein